MSVRLSPEEAWAFVAEAHTGIVVTLRRDGMPIALPMWFVVLERNVYLHTPARSKKVRRLARDPRVAFLVESGERWAELKAVHFTGRAERVDDASVLARVEAEMERKYARFRTARAEVPDRTRRHYQQAFVLLRIVPDAEVFLSWDNRKLRIAGPAGRL
jgi:PPOX class probable F420-dependent enzyme